MRSWVCLLVACAWVASMSAQCDGARYRYRIFDEIQVESGVVYGSNVGSSGANVVLDMDVYQPSNDDVTDRPVVVVAHGGFFWLEATTAWTWFPCARIWLGWGTSRRRSVTGWAWTTCSIWKPRCKRPCCGACTTPRRRFAFSARPMPRKAILMASIQTESCWEVRLRVHSSRCMRRTSTTCRRFLKSSTCPSLVWAAGWKD